MRRTAVTLAAAIALTTGVVTAAPAGAAGSTKCLNVLGTATFKPGLPKRGSSAKVKTTITLNAHVGSCSGGGVASGALTATLKAGVAGNCTSFGHEADLKITGTAKIIWNNHNTSTIAVAKLIPVPSSGFVQWRLAGDVTAHKFVGSTLSSLLWFSAGSCSTGPMTSAKIRRAKPLTIE